VEHNLIYTLTVFASQVRSIRRYDSRGVYTRAYVMLSPKVGVYHPRFEAAAILISDVTSDEIQWCRML
jgi:hypothetical protein